jgi:hypothetical protein
VLIDIVGVQSASTVAARVAGAALEHSSNCREIDNVARARRKGIFADPVLRCNVAVIR